MKPKKVKYSIYFLILFYTVGIIGFIIPETHPFFKELTPFALLLSTGFLVWFHQPSFNLKTILVFAAIFVVSFFAEMAGVQTGLVFGEYIYGDSLGIKTMGTPLMIGLNWVMLIYATKIIADKISNSATWQLFLAPSLMVVYDLILEQAAPCLEMWDWAGGVVPLQNYIAWFVLAFLFHSIIKLTKLEFKNPIATSVFIIQFFFFVTLVIYFTLSNTC